MVRDSCRTRSVHSVKIYARPANPNCRCSGHEAVIACKITATRSPSICALNGLEYAGLEIRHAPVEAHGGGVLTLY
ncbi:MAG: hypothetical protein OXE84_08790 [Rhodobacteraceae bacterium]|nr:hypothetical protein [Paracoccaceae bacterium]